MISPIGAIGVSGAAAPTPSPGTSAAATQAPEKSFAAVFEQLASGAIETVRAGEAAGIAGVRGTMATQDVVAAIMAAEQTLQTAVAIRDKVVSSYLEISRMTI